MIESSCRTVGDEKADSETVGKTNVGGGTGDKRKDISRILELRQYPFP